MKNIFSKIALCAVLGFCLTMTSCVQPVDQEELIEIGGNKGNGNGEEPGDDDGSPKLGLDNWSEITPLDRGDTVTIKLGATTPNSATIRVINTEEFDSIEWRHSIGVLGDGAEYTVNSSTPPFNVKADHLLTVQTIGIDCRPYSSFITIRVEE